MNRANGIKRRSVKSFFTETVICVAEQWKKHMGYCFVSECNHAQASNYFQFFRFFCHIWGTTQPRSPSSSATSDVTSPVKLVGKIRAIAFGSKPPLVTRIARTGLGTRMGTTVCSDPEILLPWQRDVTTSLYSVKGSKGMSAFVLKTGQSY